MSRACVKTRIGYIAQPMPRKQAHSADSLQVGKSVGTVELVCHVFQCAGVHVTYLPSLAGTGPGVTDHPDKPAYMGFMAMSRSLSHMLGP